MMLFAPAPSAEAFTPDVPAAPAAPPTICDAGSRLQFFAGVCDVRVGNADTWVLIWTRCCAVLFELDCDAHIRRNSREVVVPTLMNARVTA